MLQEPPLDKGEAKKIKTLRMKYTMVEKNQYKTRKASKMLRFLGENETSMVLMEFHKGVRGSHIGSGALAHKLLRSGYFWLTMMKYNVKFINKCDKFPRYSNLHHVATKILYSVTSHDTFINRVWIS